MEALTTILGVLGITTAFVAPVTLGAIAIIWAINKFQ